MKKRILLLALALLMLLSGCTGNWKFVIPELKSSSEIALEEGNIPDSKADTEEEQTNQLTPFSANPVTEIHCVQPSAVPSLLPAKNGNILICWTDYEKMITCFRMVNPVSDTIAASLDLEGCLDLFPESFTDHGFVLRDADNNQWIFLDSEIRKITSFQAESLDGFFSHDRSRFYYLKDRILYCADTTCGESSPLELPFDLRFSQITGFHPVDNSIALHLYISPFGTECGTAILDLDHNTFSMAHTALYQTTFGEKYVKLLHFDEQAMQYDVTYCGSESSKYIPALRFTQTGELVAVSGADYLLGVGEETELFCLSDGVASCSLSQNGIAGEFRAVCWNSETRQLIGSVWKGSSALVYALCPELLTFSEVEEAQSAQTPITVDPVISEKYWGSLSGSVLPENMQELRKLADRLEETYGIQVFLSDQGKELTEFCNYELVTTDNMNQEDEVKGIRNFLTALDQSLSMYPEGFFWQFQSVSKDGGLCFLPVEQVVNDNGVIGVCYENVDWCVIALDVRTDEMVGYLCHEIWHAIEYKLIGEDYTVFSEEVWQKMNPDGFEYNEHRSTPDVRPYRWSLFDEEGEVYFIDDYARTNSKEDRARLMEYVMAKPEFYERIQASPALMAKLQYMCEAVRKFFKDENWNIVKWEQLLE